MAGAPAPAQAKAVHLVISGRVQGVWYRGWAVDTANDLGLQGWVRNRGDGRVEAVIAGAAGAVEHMISACRKGPPAAHVTNVEVTPAAGGGAPSPFEQR